MDIRCVLNDDPAVCAPADVLRSRVMSASGKASLIEITRQALQKEGPRFLFKGWTPAFIRLGPNTVLMFVFYEVRIVLHRCI